ncbi:MAG TPA: DUF72 domain-containing protein [Actinomycetota bacterium]|nr:DUF72 domain-containing protein [Actinomycetota bacterium]
MGISAWTEPTLVKAGTFYPKKTMTAEERLRFYASEFPVAEVDSTYYAPPTLRNAELWIERTPKDFVFDIKAFSLLTGHPTRVDRLPRDLKEELPAQLAEKKNVYRDKVPGAWADEVWSRFHEALFPLHSAGKLGSVLFQFPQWFFPGRESKDYIVECAQRLSDYQLAIEFRHGSWLSEKNAERTLAFLEEHRLAFVCVDMPQGFDSSLPPVAAVTNPALAVVRFHGRDPDAWASTSGGAAERFRYDYSKAELEEWTPKVDELASQARETHVVMNNCYNDYAVKSARQLASLLDLEE